MIAPLNLQESDTFITKVFEPDVISQMVPLMILMVGDMLLPAHMMQASFHVLL